MDKIALTLFEMILGMLTQTKTLYQINKTDKGWIVEWGGVEVKRDTLEQQTMDYAFNEGYIRLSSITLDMAEQVAYYFVTTKGSRWFASVAGFGK